MTLEERVQRIWGLEKHSPTGLVRLDAEDARLDYQIFGHAKETNRAIDRFRAMVEEIRNDIVFALTSNDEYIRELAELIDKGL